MPLNEYTYTGSRYLEPLSAKIGLPVDQINFICAELFGLILAYVFRCHFHHTRVSVATRHIISFTVGVLLCLFCIGEQIWHMFFQVTVAYIIMNVVPPDSIQKSVLLWSMAYLSFKHVFRMTTDYGGYILDVTGPIMVTTQKLISLAFSYHDGRFKRDEDLTDDQRSQCVRRLPSLLEFYSYLFCFHGVLIGPLAFYNDYESFIEGRNFKTKPHDKESIDYQSEPSSNRVVAKKLLFCGFCVFVTLYILPHFPASKCVDLSHIASYGVIPRLAYVVMAVSCLRFKYYFAWILSETVCHASGLGFNGYDEKGRAKWDLVDNVNVKAIETSTSFKLFIERWNSQTIVWLRRVCYNRVSVQRVLITNMLSAFWHGFYPGYYFSFIGIAAFTIAGRKVRRMLRPHFLSTQRIKLCYDIVTWIVSHLVMAYVILPFVLLEFATTVRFYNSMYWFIHIIVFVIIIAPYGSSTANGSVSQQKCKSG